MSTFEFTIRILGGLLSGYYLSQDIRLLHKAEEAGDVVYAAFSNSTAFPHVIQSFLFLIIRLKSI